MEADNQAFQPNAPASPEALAFLRTGLVKSLLESYFAYLSRGNGSDGFIRDGYAQLWWAEELAEMNCAYKTAEFFPNFFFIGSDGGAEAYAFDLSCTDANVDPLILTDPEKHLTSVLRNILAHPPWEGNATVTLCYCTS